ncbi:MAG: hypothetical protein KGL95_09085, partial [Patescibacteria group bacterium]|nr:hypothetical protein [Patescibacteria group bacterium]
MIRPSESAGTYYWHTPRLSPVPGQSLVWDISRETYDVTNHTKSRIHEKLEFGNYGISNPVVARALLGLVEMHVLSYGDLRLVLNKSANLQIQPETVSDALTETISGLEKKTLYNFTYLGQGLLNSRFMQAIFQDPVRMYDLPFFELLDRASEHPNKDAGFKVVDTFVTYYTTLHKMILNKAEAQLREEPFASVTVPQPDKGFAEIQKAFISFFAAFVAA